MKLLAILGACLLLATIEVDGRSINQTLPLESFAKLAANITASGLEFSPNPTNTEILTYKLMGIDVAAGFLGIPRPGHQILNFKEIYEHILKASVHVEHSVKFMRQYITKRIDQLREEHEPLSSDSEVSKIINTFSDEVADKVSTVFENKYAELVNVTEEFDKIAARLLGPLDELVAKIDKCMQIPWTENRQFFQCHAERRSIMESMMDDTRALHDILAACRSESYGNFSEVITMFDDVKDQIKKLKQRDV